MLSAILLITLIRILYQVRIDRKESCARYKDLQVQYNQLYQENQNLCERLKNSIAFFRQQENLQKDLQTKNQSLQLQLKAEQTENPNFSLKKYVDIRFGVVFLTLRQFFQFGAGESLN